MPIRILLVDDSPEFLRALSRFLSSDPEIQIVGHAYLGPGCAGKDEPVSRWTWF